MKSLKITVRHFRAFLLMSKNFFASDCITWRKTAIHWLKLSFKQSSISSLSMPSAQLMHRRQRWKMWSTCSRPWLPISSFVKADKIACKIGGSYSKNSLTSYSSSIFSIRYMRVLRPASTSLNSPSLTFSDNSSTNSDISSKRWCSLLYMTNRTRAKILAWRFLRP